MLRFRYDPIVNAQDAKASKQIFLVAKSVGGDNFRCNLRTEQVCALQRVQLDERFVIFNRRHRDRDASGLSLAGLNAI